MTTFEQMVELIGSALLRSDSDRQHMSTSRRSDPKEQRLSSSWDLLGGSGDSGVVGNGMSGVRTSGSSG